MSISFQNVSHVYPVDAKTKIVALDDISIDLNENKMCAIIGTTGSGKSTFVQHLNGLLLPTSGKVHVLDFELENGTKTKLKQLRQRVGLVFQFPEYQLFEETVEKDIMFGPKNFGLDEQTIRDNVNKAIKQVNLEPSLLQASPLDLSGGQKRRVAIAGVLAMQPDILVLDEPTAGLDPAGAQEMMKVFKNYHDLGHSVFIVTHDMDNVLNYCNEVMVLHEAKLIYYGDVMGFFNDDELMSKAFVLPPTIIQLRNALIDAGFNIKKENSISIASLANQIAKEVK